MAVVTALRAERRDRVAVELDGVPWRVVPAEAVLRAGLDVGRKLDRERARLLRRELVRLDALRTVNRTVARADVSVQQLRCRLDRIGTPPAERERTLAAAARAGLVDDRRLAHGRAAALAERGYGDAAIDADLDRRGVAQALRAEAIAALEAEEHRAKRLVARRGAGTRTAHYLAARGFGEEALAAAREASFATDP